MYGNQVTKKIRHWESTHGQGPTPILALRANALKEEVKESLQAGCTTYSTKPIKKDRLLQATQQFAHSTRRIWK